MKINMISFVVVQFLIILKTPKKHISKFQLFFQIHLNSRDIISVRPTEHKMEQ